MSKIMTFTTPDEVIFESMPEAVISTENAYHEVMYKLVASGGYIMSKNEYRLFKEKNGKTTNINAMLFATGAKTCKSHKFLIYPVKNVNEIIPDKKSVPFVYVIPAIKEVVK